MLRSSESEYVIYVPVSSRVSVKRARLHLELTNSISLLPGRSQLSVMLNDSVVAQIPLKARQPSVKADITLPVERLDTGYNRLSFRVAQHYTLECEDPSAPELWTQIDAEVSELSFEAALRPIEPRLSEIGELIDRRGWGPYRLVLLTAEGTMDDAALGWGALVAQGAALRLEYKALELQWRQVGSSLDSLRGADHVLLGTRDQLEPLLGKARAQEIEGPVISIEPLEADPTHFLLILSGPAAEDVELAAKVFSHLNTLFPDTASLEVSSLDLPRLGSYLARRGIRPNAVFTFAELGLDTVTVGGIDAHGARLEFWVPPDLYSASDEEIDLRLHLAHGAAMRKDSVLNVLLNGTFENVIHIKDDDGAVFRGYHLRIPLRSLRPGPNEISFQPQLMPLITGECQAIQYDNLLLTLFGDSELEVPAAEHRVLLPDLSLLARTGFPYTLWPDGSGVAVEVTGRSEGSVEAAWTLAARMSQILGYPWHGAHFSFSRPDDDLNLIVIGPEGELPKDLVRASPLVLGEKQVSHYPTLTGLSGRTLPAGVIGRFKLWLMGPGPAPAPAVPESAVVTQRAGLGRYCAAMQFESPRRRRRTVTLFTASSAERLARGISELVEPSLWGGLQGDLAVWQPERKGVEWYKVGHAYAVGSSGVRTRIAFIFSYRPWFWLMILGLSTLLFAWITRRLLVRYRQRHHPGMGDAA